MKNLPLNEEDADLFNRDMTAEMLVFFDRHEDTFQRMFYDQGKLFWQNFVIKFRIHATKYGYICQMNSKNSQKGELNNFIDDVFIFLHENIVAGTVKMAKDVVHYTATVCSTLHLIDKKFLLKTTMTTKNPFYMANSREAYRILFGQPNVISVGKAMLMGPLYSRFSAAICTALHRWLNADYIGRNPSLTHAVVYKSFDELCADCLLFTAARYSMEKTCGSMIGPKHLTTYWNKGDPRFKDSNNPLYNKTAKPHSDWRTALKMADWARFIQYLRESECPCYTSNYGMMPTVGYNYPDERKKAIRRYLNICREIYDSLTKATTHQKKVVKKKYHNLRMLEIAATAGEYESCFVMLPDSATEYAEPFHNSDSTFHLSSPISEFISHKFYGLSTFISIDRGTTQLYSADTTSKTHYITTSFDLREPTKGWDLDKFRVKITCPDEKRLDWLMLCVINHVYKFTTYENGKRVGIMDMLAWIHLFSPEVWTGCCVRIQYGISSESALHDGDLLKSWTQFDNLEPYLFFNEDNIDYLQLRYIDMTFLIPFLRARGFHVPNDISTTDFKFGNKPLSKSKSVPANNDGSLTISDTDAKRKDETKLIETNKDNISINKLSAGVKEIALGTCDSKENVAYGDFKFKKLDDTGKSEIGNTRKGETGNKKEIGKNDSLKVGNIVDGKGEETCDLKLKSKSTDTSSKINGSDNGSKNCTQVNPVEKGVDVEVKKNTESDDVKIVKSKDASSQIKSDQNVKSGVTTNKDGGGIKTGENGDGISSKDGQNDKGSGSKTGGYEPIWVDGTCKVMNVEKGVYQDLAMKGVDLGNTKLDSKTALFNADKVQSGKTGGSGVDSNKSQVNELAGALSRKDRENKEKEATDAEILKATHLKQKLREFAEAIPETCLKSLANYMEKRSKEESEGKVGTKGNVGCKGDASNGDASNNHASNNGTGKASSGKPGSGGNGNAATKRDHSKGKEDSGKKGGNSNNVATKGDNLKVQENCANKGSNANGKSAGTKGDDAKGKENSGNKGANAKNTGNKGDNVKGKENTGSGKNTGIKGDNAKGKENAGSKGDTAKGKENAGNKGANAKGKENSGNANAGNTGAKSGNVKSGNAKNEKSEKENTSDGAKDTGTTWNNCKDRVGTKKGPEWYEEFNKEFYGNIRSGYKENVTIYADHTGIVGMSGHGSPCVGSEKAEKTLKVVNLAKGEVFQTTVGESDNDDDNDLHIGNKACGKPAPSAQIAGKTQHLPMHADCKDCVKQAKRAERKALEKEATNPPLKTSVPPKTTVPRPPKTTLPPKTTAPIKTTAPKIDPKASNQKTNTAWMSKPQPSAAAPFTDKKADKKKMEETKKKGLKMCNHCGMEEMVAHSFKKCQKCKETGVVNMRYYCGRECQILDWKAGHRNDH